MGKWNRRWASRKKYCQEAPEPSHRLYYTDHVASGVWQNSMPSWEKQFCTLVGSVPWEKVVVAKRYMYCHDNVVKWNDSAGEEAFNNAKERFWAAVNGLPCDIPLPDPYMYIDEIDWNPHIDPEQISDLDREYFNPDEGGKDNKVETMKQKAHNSVSGYAVGWHGYLNNGDNPWEGSDVKGTGASKDAAQGWNQWGGSVNGWMNSDNAKNPWEQSYTRDNGAVKDNAWGICGDKSWGWNQGQTCNEQSKNFFSPWERGYQNVESAKEKEGGGAVGNSWDLDRWVTNVHESRKFNSGHTRWAQTLNQGNGSRNDGGWGDCRDKSWGWKHSGNQNNEPKHLDSRSGGALNGGCRKREGSHHYSSRQKSLRLQGDDYGTDHHWRIGRTQNRVSFRE